MKLRIGARGSALSLAQTEIVASALRRRAGLEVEVVTFRTTGDRLSRLGAEISRKGVFTKEIDEALWEGRVDLGVHSLKDLPSETPEGLVLAAVPPREDPSDVLISGSVPLSALPAGARIGTGSPRRKAQLLALRPDLEIVEARGNVDTRIRRLHEGRWDAIVLARAGLARLGLLGEVTETLGPDRMLPAIGQGALAVMAREGDTAAAELVAELNHEPSRLEVIAERTLLRYLEAGCRAPLAGLARFEDGALTLRARVFSPDGRRLLEEEGRGPAADPEALGKRVAEKLLERGAAELIAEARA